MYKPKTHWWLLIWKDTGYVYGTYDSRWHARYAKRDAISKHRLELVKVVKQKERV